MDKTRRALLLAVLASFLGLSAFELFRPPANAFMDLSFTFTDHFSHMNAGRLFTRNGKGVWQRPLDQTLPPLSAQEWSALPADVRQCRDGVYLVPGWKKPVEQSWPSVVRFYPPGDMLLTAPVAALYHFTGLSFSGANRLLLILFLAAAHFGLFLYLDGLRAGGLWRAALPAYLGVNVVIHWTLEGFYDAAMLAPLLLCWRWFGEKRGLAAAVAFCAAMFIHFRAIYYLPWAISAAALLTAGEAWRRWTPRDWLAAATGMLLGTAAVATLLLCLPGLLAFRDSPSALLVAPHHLDGPALRTFALVAALALAAFIYARASLDVAVLCWLALVLTLVRQSYAWYAVALVPWLGTPADPREGSRATAAVAGRALVFIFLVCVVHADTLHWTEGVTPLWIPRLFAQGASGTAP